jgi:hypothetical protein
MAPAALLIPVALVCGSKLENIPTWKLSVPSGMDMEYKGRNQSRKASEGIGPRI